VIEIYGKLIFWRLMKHCSQPMKKINFIIAAFNEESRTSDVILSIKDFADQIVIMDPGSTDDTVEIARNIYPVKVCTVTTDFFDIAGRFSVVFPELAKSSSSDWVMYLNCSEYFNEEIGVTLIERINSDSRLCAIDMYRQSFTFGVPTHTQKILYVFRHLFSLKNNFRLFKMHAFDAKNSRMHTDFPICKMPFEKTTFLMPFGKRFLRHDRAGELRDFDLKHSIYSENEAMQRYKKGIKPSLFRMLLMPVIIILYFMPSLFINRKSFIVAIYHAFHRFQVESKLYMLYEKNK
jgi:glycosyltransferase involved in cell wall biosynthesis